MIELARHIEFLLLENDCVIVPGFGGFIAHYQPASYDEVESLFVPPLRTIGFNPQLTMNDGLLIQSYMQAYHTDYSDATRIISEKVKELKEVLYTEGFYDLVGIGTLNYTMYRTYEFNPKENGILSPTLYGLDSFQMLPLSLETEEVNILKTEDIQWNNTYASRKVKRMIPNWLGNAAAVAIAVIMFFILSAPVENTHIDEGNYASLGSISLFDAIRSQSFATTLMNQVPEVEEAPKMTEQYPKVVKVEKVAPAIQPDEPAKVTIPVKKSVATKPVELVVEKNVIEKSSPKKLSTKRFHIIVASLTTSSDAERMLQTYKQAGYINASIIGNKERFRISLCSFEEKTMAYKKLDELKQIEDFKNAWMLTSKK